MISRLIKWLATMLFVVVAGTLIGWTIPIIIAAVPLWGFVVAFMIAAVVLFKAAVWVITHGGW